MTSEGRSDVRARRLGADNAPRTCTECSTTMEIGDTGYIRIGEEDGDHPLTTFYCEDCAPDDVKAAVGVSPREDGESTTGGE